MKFRGFYLTCLLLGTGLVSLLLEPRNFTLSFPLNPQNQTVFRVPQDYPTIQAAVHAAPEGAIIQIAPGEYMENIIITKSLKLVGSGIEKTILQSNLSLPDRDGRIPAITVQTGEGQEFHIERLTVRPSVIESLIGFVPNTIGIKIEGQGSASLYATQTRWMNLQVVFQAVSLHSLEIYESIFQRNGYIFDNSQNLAGTKIDVNRAVIAHNRFQFNRDGITLGGSDLRVIENIVHNAASFHYNSGIELVVQTEKGRGEIVGNTVMLSGIGISFYQWAKEATWMIHNNLLVMNSVNIMTDIRNDARIDIFIERNSVIDGVVGIFLRMTGTITGGSVHIRNNKITGQRIFWPPDPHDVRALSGMRPLPTADGILILQLSEPKEQLQIDLSENAIGNNEGYGLALNRAFRFDSARYGECGVFKEGMAHIKIIGSSNDFYQNALGDLCPADYPWPPGFRK